MIALLIILSYLVVGLVGARIAMPILWRRSEGIDFYRSEFDTARGYVTCLSILTMFLWPAYIPVIFIMSGVERTNPDRRIAELKQARENEKVAVRQLEDSRRKALRDINMLESANGMPLSTLDQIF